MLYCYDISLDTSLNQCSLHFSGDAQGGRPAVPASLLEGPGSRAVLKARTRAVLQVHSFIAGVDGSGGTPRRAGSLMESLNRFLQVHQNPPRDTDRAPAPKNKRSILRFDVRAEPRNRLLVDPELIVHPRSGRGRV